MRRWLVAAIAVGLLGAVTWAQPSLVKDVPPTVRRLDAAALDNLLRERHGRPLLINVWATWCVPCVEEFPDLVRLDSVYRDRGLDVAVVSLDFEDEVTSKIQPFLRSHRARMPAYVNVMPKPEQLIDRLSPDWSGAVPATFTFDRSGALREMLVGKQDWNTLMLKAEGLLRAGSKQ